MKYRIISLLSAALIIVGEALPAWAEESSEKPPNISFGIAGSFSGLSAWEREKGDKNMRYNLMAGYGGGIVFEKMFSNLLGVHAGIWCNSMRLDIRMKEPPNILTGLTILNLFPMKMTVKGWTMSIPLSLVLSFNASLFSFNILGGIKYTHVLESMIRKDNVLPSFKKNYDFLPYVNQPQFGFTIGVHFKFRVARFTDIFIGSNGVLYVTNFMKVNNGISLLYDISALTGVMFRTNVFPMRD